MPAGTPDPDRGSAQAADPVARFTALVLAGRRLAGDPLAQGVGVSHKALAPVAGVPMLARVVDTLRAARTVGRIVVCGIEREALALQSGLGALLAGGTFDLVTSRATPSASVLAVLQQPGTVTPLLVTTADHPLLTATVVDDFCRRSARGGADVTVGLVPARLVREAFPGLRRTALPFRDGSYCGCNLYAFLTPNAQRAPAAWMQVEQHRKRPWRMVGSLGVGVTLRFLLRRLTIEAVTALASDRMGADVRPIILAHPEAGFDVDTLDQRDAAEAFLRARETRRP